MEINIKSLLAKYKNLKDPKEEKAKIAKIISEILGKEILGSQITITKNVLKIKTNNYLKTEIFMKKEKILEELKKNNFHTKEIG